MPQSKSLLPLLLWFVWGGPAFGQQGFSETPGAPVLKQSYADYSFGGVAEQRWPFDTQQAWVHGYFQEIPAYGGARAFRPYNYKHVLAQTQVAGGWGLVPQTAYSQQWWHRYQDQAAMLEQPSVLPPSRIPSEQDPPPFAAPRPYQPAAYPPRPSGRQLQEPARNSLSRQTSYQRPSAPPQQDQSLSSQIQRQNELLMQLQQRLESLPPR